MATLNIIDLRPPNPLIPAFELPPSLAHRPNLSEPTVRKMPEPDLDIKVTLKNSKATFKSLHKTIHYFSSPKSAWIIKDIHWYDSKDRCIQSITIQENSVNFFSPNGYLLLEIKSNTTTAKQRNIYTSSPVTVISDPSSDPSQKIIQSKRFL